jgi:hypothetical protein
LSEEAFDELLRRLSEGEALLGTPFSIAGRTRDLADLEDLDAAGS